MSGTNEEPLKPGEVDLLAPDPPAVETPAVDETPGVDAAATDDEAVDETPAAAEPAKPERKLTGAVGELVERRVENRLLRERLAQFEQDPVLGKLTPDIRQAIAEGRIVVQPPRTTADAEQERLVKLANKLGLEVDGKPDLDAARRASSAIRDEVNEAVRPLAEQAQAMTDRQMREVANNAVTTAVDFAKSKGMDVDFVRGEFERIAANNPRMLTDENVALEVWHSTVGKMHAAGKLTNAQARQLAPSGAPTGAAAPVLAEPTGRRAPSTTVTLSASAQAAYKNHGLDPAKAYSTTLGKIDISNGLSLED